MDHMFCAVDIGESNIPFKTHDKLVQTSFSLGSYLGKFDSIGVCAVQTCQLKSGFTCLSTAMFVVDLDLKLSICIKASTWPRIQRS